MSNLPLALALGVMSRLTVGLVALGALGAPHALATALDVKASGEKAFYLNPRAANSQITIFSRAPLEDFTTVSNRVSGEWRVDPKNLESTRGYFAMRIEDLRTGLDVRDRDLRARTVRRRALSRNKDRDQQGNGGQENRPQHCQHDSGRRLFNAWAYEPRVDPGYPGVPRRVAVNNETGRRRRNSHPRRVHPSIVGFRRHRSARDRDDRIQGGERTGSQGCTRRRRRKAARRSRSASTANFRRSACACSSAAAQVIKQRRQK